MKSWWTSTGVNGLAQAPGQHVSISSSMYSSASVDSALIARHIARQWSRRCKRPVGEVVHLDEVVHLRVVGTEEVGLGFVQPRERFAGRGRERHALRLVGVLPQRRSRLFRSSMGMTAYVQPKSSVSSQTTYGQGAGSDECCVDEVRDAPLLRELDVTVRVSPKHEPALRRREEHVLSEQAPPWPARPP